ncbi:MAG: 16S rRNA (uracil(1498)-N(3))-methyltransferase [Calditrichaeota bacterium]|nr:16S rRNA (uracil(1498)-N(3))-methyltransferase [Calditrichota bacterium]
MVNQHHGEFVFVGESRREADRFTLSEEEAHHLLRVRRVRSGQTVFATDGKGTVFRTRLEEDNSLLILESYSDFAEPPLKITLACGCLQGDTSKDVVRTAVQLGVHRIVWVRMARSQEAYSENKLAKLHRVAIQALKQTGRAWLPEQLFMPDLASVTNSLENCGVWVAHPLEAGSDPTPARDTETDVLVVGPEGGFADEELALLANLQAHFLTLGPRRLRSETAVAAGVSLLLTQAGEFK